ncbi:MAG: substrate-binding domain-containing protein [Chloroflexota bacterium]|nr:substrate-binding domain-containing protein [Chloroflexota bacterium]MDE2886204.1 substrate-binding domain-containing protein [Chloroflexota bacterium]
MLSSILKAHHISRADLAHRLDVSVQTVHNWCSGRILIPSRKLGRLCDLLEALGVPPDELAQLAVRELETLGVQQGRLALRSRSAQPVVGLVTWDLMNPGLFGPLARVARTALEGMGYQCMALDCGGEHRQRRAYLQWAVQADVDGLLLCGVPGDVPDPDEDLFASLKPVTAKGIPVVLLKPWTGSSVAIPEGIGSIGWDSLAAVEMAVGLLQRFGHEHVHAVLADTGAGFGGRYRGLDHAWSNLGLPFDEDSIIWTQEGETTHELADALTGTGAIFTPPSQLPTVARACFSGGIRWPDDISIVSLGNRAFVPQMDRRPFTFVTIPIGRVGRGAAQVLSSMVRGERFQTGQEYVIYGASTMSIENERGGSVGHPMQQAGYADAPRAALA